MRTRPSRRAIADVAIHGSLSSGYPAKQPIDHRSNQKEAISEDVGVICCKQEDGIADCQTEETESDNLGSTSSI